MYHLIYISSATRQFSESELYDLLISARSNNVLKKITGMLIFLQDKFIQVLEGNKREVLALLEVIRSDPRHEKLTIILEGTSTSRLFKNWSMGFKSLDLERFHDLSGYRNPKLFFKKHNVTDDSHPVMIFLKLFYNKNYVDYPEIAPQS